MEQIKFSKVRNVRTPEYGTPGSAGIDFFIPEDQGPNICVAPGEDVLIPSGIKVNLPKDIALVAKNKSGVVTSFNALCRAGKTPKSTSLISSLIVGACVVDCDYQGEIHLHFINTGKSEVILHPGMKVAQFLPYYVPQYELIEVSADTLYDGTTQRGEGSFGSTTK